MSAITGGVGGCTSILHLIVQYPKIAACAAILGVGGYTITPEQLAACNEKVAQCQAMSMLEGGTTNVVTPPVTLAVEPPSVAIETEPEPINLCEGAPVMKRSDIFTVTSPERLWKRGGVDPVRGHAPEAYLKLLGFTDEQRAEFLGMIARGEGSMSILQNGTHVGDSTSGSGKVMRNAVVAFNPIIQRGDNHTRDNRMRTYTYDRKVMLDGACVTHRVTLIEPFVCQNWSRPSDIILPVTVSVVAPIQKKEE